MKKDKIQIYVLEIVLVLFLLFTLFASNIEFRWILACFFLIYLFVANRLLGKKGIKSVYEKQVINLMLIFAFIYLGVFYGLGLYYGFEKTKYFFTFKSLLRFIIPTIIIIICSEKIRYVLISQNGEFRVRGRKIDFSNILIFASMVLADYIIYANMYSLSNLEDFLTAIGFILFASISNNLLFNYVSKRFGNKPIILFRFITVLYVYFLPIQPDVYLFLSTFLRMLFPFLIYMVLERTYARNTFVVSFKDKKKNVVSTLLLLIGVTAVIMLISCQFKYGIVVIGTSSMTGTINRGDAIIYERYDHNKLIKKGQIIVFDYNGLKTIHRVVEIKNINGTTRYFTKGDANKDMDDGYRLLNNIDGLVRLRIKYIGLPTLWLRSLFN